MKIVKLRSDYDCIVRNEDGENFLDINSQLVFDKPEKILVYPLSKSDKNLFPFYIDLDSSTNSRFFKRFSFKNFDIIYLSSSEFVENEIIETIELNKKEYRICISETRVTFEDEKLKKSFNIENNFNSYSLSSHGNLIILHLIGKIETMWIYNTNTKIINYISGKKIEKFDNKLLVSSSLGDITCHEAYITYNLTDDELIKQSTKLKFEDKDSCLVKNKKVIPIAFLEAIKIGDFDLARKYLSEPLKQTTDEHFKSYFKNILKIIPVEDDVFGVMTENDLKLFKFIVTGFFITEIESYDWFFKEKLD